MRKLIFLFLIFACFAQAQSAKPAPAQAKPALGWCRLGTDPVDSSRQPDWAAECIIKVPATPVVMTTGSGRKVQCLLPPLTPVVVDRGTGVARWVLQCGNPIVSPANWVPSGPKICGPEPAVVPAVPAPAAAPVTAQPSPLEVKVGGEVRVVHEGEVRLVHEVSTTVPEPAPAQAPAPEPTPAPAPQPRKGWWSRNWKWVVPVAIVAGAGTAAAVLARGGGNIQNNVIIYQPLPPPVKR